MKNSSVNKIIIVGMLILLVTASGVPAIKNQIQQAAPGDVLGEPSVMNQTFIISSHPATQDEVNERKQQLGVFDPSKNYNKLFGEYGTGLAPPTEEAYENMAGSLLIVDKITPPKTLLTTFDLSTDPCFPKVGNQLSQGSCAAWAATYYAGGYVIAKNYNWNQAYLGNNDQLLSPAWTYNKCNGGGDYGSWMSDNMVVMQTVGCSRMSQMPYYPSDPVGWGAENAWRDAPSYRADNVYDVPHDINTIKTIITSGYPITFALDAYSYYYFGSDDVLGSTVMLSDLNHGNTIVGYDDTKLDAETGEVGAFKIVNSWGKTWGPDHNGYYWMTYQAFLGTWNSASLNYVDCLYVSDHPKLLGVWTLDPQGDRSASVTLGIGSYSNPLETRQPWWDGQSAVMHTYPAFMCLDITEFYDEWITQSMDFYLDIGDAVHDGKITSFTVEYYKDSYHPGEPTKISAQSPDTPKNTPCYVRVLGFNNLDNIPPQYRQQSQSRTYVPQTGNITLRAQGRDNFSLNWSYLATNESGTWQNISGNYGSPLQMQQTYQWQWSNFTWHNPSIPLGRRIGWRIYYIDTSNNYVRTPIMSFLVTTNSPPYNPGNPSPADGTTSIDLNADLSWTGGDPNPEDIVTYDIFFGATNPPQKVVSNQSALTYDPGTLAFITTYYWKIVAWDDFRASTVGSTWQFTTKINSPPNPPSNPNPSNNAIEVTINTDLSWTGGDLNPEDMVTYDVYFATTNPPTKVSSNQTATLFILNTLPYNTTYYWKIDAWDDHGAKTNGSLWQFTTKIFDITPPQWCNQGQSRTIVTPGSSIELYAQGKDNVGLDKAYLATNETGDWFMYSGGEWWNSQWNYSKQIRIDHTKVQGNLANFPLLVNIVDSGLRDKAQDSGDDIVFVDATNTTKLNHEIESFNGTTGELLAWVNVPLLSSSQDTIFYMYYGNPTCTNQQNVQGTWDTSYRMVHHLKGASYMELDDSTSNHWDVSSAYGNPGYNQAGKIGKCVDLDPAGGWDYFKTGAFRLLTDSSYTGSAWIYVDGNPTSIRYVFEGDSSRGISLVVNSDGKIYALANTDQGLSFCNSTTVVNTNNPQWIYVCTRADTLADRLDVFVNGISEGHTALNGAIVPENVGLNVGASQSETSRMNGRIDELRVSNIPRSDAWIHTEYTMMNSPSTFLTLGEEHNGSGGTKYESPKHLGGVGNQWVWSNFTWQNPDIPEGTRVGWRIYYVDTSNNIIVTDIMSFNITTQTPVNPPVKPTDTTPWHQSDNRDLNKGICGRNHVHATYTYTTTSTNTGQIYYKFYWGDGTNSDWLGPNTSGQFCTASHAWTNASLGNRQIIVICKVNDVESTSSPVLTVRMYRLGDISANDITGFDDINPFVLMLASGKNMYYDAFPMGYWFTGDINLDTLVDFADINPFVALLTGG